MSDLLVRGGNVVDGTGSPPRRADVRVRNGTIVEVGAALAPDGEAQLDATGALVAPGFIDTHTHYDPSLWWDSSADPMSLHGVTTIVQGNCSLSLAPLAPEHRTMLIDAFCFIEDMPVAAFERGIPWNWRGWREYRESFDERGCAVNVAALVGHSALRLHVLGEESIERASTPHERTAIAELLEDCLAAGALGLSTSFADVDRHGRPVPSRAADDDEFVALAGVLHGAERSIIEFVPSLSGEAKLADIERIHRACAGTGVRGTWTQLAAGGRSAEDVPRLLEQAERTQREGVGVFPQVSPRSFDVRINLDQTVVFITLPHWNRWVQTDRASKLATLADPEWRAAMREEWERKPYSLFPKGRMHKLRIVAASNPRYAPFVSRPFSELLAQQPGGHEADVFADFLLDNQLDCELVVIGLANDDPAEVARLLVDPRIVVGGSDAGAHLQMLCGAGDTSLLIARHVVERGDLPIEHAVHLLTQRAAQVFGITNRGVVAPGRAGDLVVFEPERIVWPDEQLVHDLPDGSARLTRPHGGYRATVVGGVCTQVEGVQTAARPGRMIPG
jgi:N-acyl-D-amino-acid deacylase